MSENKIASAKAKEREYALSDGGGLWLFVLPSGSKIWRFRYTLNGKQGRISIGQWPVSTKEEARDACVKYQKRLAHGLPPVSQDVPATFEQIAREWIATQLAPCVTPKRVRVVTARFENYIFPHIGSRDIRTLTAPEILSVIRKAEGQEIFYSAHTLRA